MVRETRHLWVGNLPDSIREDRIRDHFKRYGRVQSVKLLGSRKEDEGGGLCATVSFMDIKSASKAHHGEHKLEDRILTTEYHEPPSIPSTNSIHYSSRYPSSEEVVGFERSHFYETGGREGRDYLSRRYHAEPAIPPRSRRQDARIYRNGPYTALISPTTERSRADHHGRSWGYESPRYTTTSVPTPQEIYPEERREASCLHSSKKHSKSRSGSDSASTASSRSRSSSPSSRSSSCSSATSSPASDKSCSTHSQHGSLRGNAGSVNASSINSSSPAIHNEDRRPLAICVRNLPARSSDTSLKDGLYHEYKKHGKVTWVKVVGQGSERYAVVCFKKTEDVDKALQVSHDKLFFGCKIDVAPYQGYDVDDNEFSFVCRPFEADQDEFHPKATRTLFIGNLEKDITMQEIRKHFDQFGEILDIDIKKQGTTSSSYAFCQYTDIASVVRAIRSLDGEHLGSTRVKLGFGKSLHTNCVWVDGISESVSEKYLSQHFSQFGPVSHVLIDRTRGQALISFEQITYAQQAVKEMRGVMLRGRKLQIDYASRECQEAFYEHMDKQSNQHSNYDTRSYEDVISVEDGEARHKERVEIEECQSSGEEGSGRRKCKHRRSEGDSSRPGTPLCDERPEPAEPRRPRERTQDPLSLPLPRFATQVLPPPSPPSSDDSQPSPPSPEWEERLRSLDEKYRKWSGSRTNPTRPDPTSVRLRHRLLALDPHDLQPSDIVKSLLAKRSVFDEDLKRLENFGEKYEPKEFVPGRVLRSPGSPVQGKGLQYPFPSHPDPSRPPTSNVSTPMTTNTSPANTNNPPSFTKPQSQPSQQVPAPIVKSKAEKTEIKKDITSSLLVSSIKPKPFRRDSEPSEARRKSREEAPEVTKSLESAVKKDDTSDCDKVKDAQVCERRKSTAEKRRSSVDIKESNLVEVLDKVKDCSEKKELRRASCDSIESDSKLKDPRKQIHDSVDIPTNFDADKHKKLDSEYRKDIELGSKNSGNIDIDRKKDIFGVNSEKDRRRKDNAEGSSDNLKHKKVPETNKCDSLALKPDSDETKTSDREEKRKEEAIGIKIKDNKKEQASTERERRRDSMDSDSKRPTKQDEFPKYKDVKMFNELKPLKKDSESEFNNLLNKKESEKEVNKPKESEKKKNSDSEISKETSLFKKVFGFTDSLRNKDNNKKTDNSTTKVETPDKQKEKKEVINECKSKKDLEIETRHKSVSRKSPDNQDVKHKDSQEKKKNSEVNERKKKDLDITSDDFLPKDYDLNYHNKRKVIERCLNREALNINNDNDHLNKYSKEHDKKKDYYYDEFDALLESCKHKENENKHDNFAKDHKKKEYSDVTKNDKRINSESHFDSDKFFDSDRKADPERLRESKGESNSEILKFKHSDKHSDRKRHQEFLENSKYKEDKKKEESHERHRKKDSTDFDNIRQKEESSKNNDRKKDHFDNNKFRDMDDAVRKRKDLESLEQTKPKETSERKKDILEKERRRDRELVDAKYKDNDEKRKDGEKEKKRKDIESHEKLNGDHIDCIFDSVEEHDQKDLSNKKEKKKDHRMNSWPASIGCKRRLSSQDSDLVDDAKRSKQERRDSKDSGKSSSSSSKKGDKHGKSFSRILEERIKEDKEHDKKKEDIELTNEEKHKKQLKKEKKIEKKKEEKKFRVRLKENGTASESDLNSADDEIKNLKRQHSIFDIVDDEPAYISMYDKVKARSTKNMQKQEEEKRQEKLKEKFSQLKQSRAKREEKKRSTSYDGDSDSDHGGCGGLNRRNKLMITSSEDEGGSDCEIKLSSRTKKLTFDFSEDEGMLVTPKSRLIRSHNADHESRTRKILSDTSEDDVLRHSTPKLKTKVSIEMEMKSRKIMSDTSEDDTLKCLTRIKASRIQSDESDNEVDSYNDNKEPDSNQHHTNSVSDDLYSTREFTNHNIEKTLDHNTDIRSPSPEDFRRNSLDVAEMPRKKKKQKKQKNLDDGDGSSSKKHSSKKDKKKSHSKDDDENCKKSKKKKDRDNNKREEKMEDIFGPLSDDSDKALRWHVNQVKMTEVFRVDSDSELEIIRKKEKRRREKKARELDEAGRALEANLMMDPSETYQVVEPVKNKKKKRKKSRDEKIKHHHSESASLDQRIEEERNNFMDNFIDYTKSHQQKIRQSIEKELKISEKDEDDYVSEEFTKENRIDEDSQQRMEEEAIESILPHNNSDSEDTSSKVRPKSMSSLLDSPPPAAQQIQQQQQHPHQPKKIDIPGFRGLDVDEDIHETAVKSISESSSNSIQINEPKFEPEKTEQTSNDEKPTPVISQEETEDAVAALLMEDPFNGTSGDFESYTEDTPKPDTPASEPDLQIDTDAEETYDIDISKPPRTPDIPQSFYRQVDTREGLEERILPLVCPSDTPIKEEIKVLEVPRTPGSGLERKAEEDQPADIQPIKLNLDSPEKQIKEEPETSDPQLCETETIKDIKNSSFEIKNEIDEPMDTKEAPIVPQECTDLVDKPKQESSDAIFDSLMRGSIINDSVKKELVKPPADSASSNPPNSFVTKVVATVPQPSEPKHLAELEPIVIKQNTASVVTQIGKEVENLNVVSGDTTQKTSTIINKMIQSTPTPTQVSAAIQQTKIATPEEKTDVDVLRVSVGGLSQSCIKSPTRIVQVAPSSPVAIPQLHFSSNVNSVSSPLGLVRTSTIQTHPITPQTRPASPQVHHLTVIPNQQVRSPGSPLMMQHGLTPKPGSQMIQPTSGNPVIRHTVSSNVQPVKPASTIVVSQPNIQRQLQIVTQPSHLSPPNIKLVRTEQPSSPLNIVRLARPVMPNHCLSVRQSVPLLQPISTADIRPSIPIHDAKEPPSLIALQDKPIIQHTVSHISTPVNVIKNPLMEIPKVLEQTRDVKITHTFDRDSVPELKELTPPFPVGMDLPKDLIKQPTSFKNMLNNEENSTSNDGQNYVLDDTKPLNAVIHDLASKLNSKHANEEDKSIEKMNEIENDESEKQHSEVASGMDSDLKDHTLVKKPELVLPDDIISIRTDDSQDYEINKPELEIKDETSNDVKEMKSDESNLNTNDDDLPKVDSPKVNLEEKIQEETTVEEKEEPKKAEESKQDEYNLDKAIDTSKNIKNHTEHPPENEDLEKEEEPMSPMEVQEEARIEKAVIVKESGGTRHVRRRKRKVRLGPVRRAKNTPATPVKTSTDIYEFRDDSEEERPRLILTIKSPPDRSEPIKIKATPTTRKSRRLQEKDGGNCRKAPVVEHTVEGPVIKTSNRPGRRATRSTQPNLTVTLNPEPRKSPRRKHAQHAQPAAAPIEEKVVRMESPPTPPPTPAAAAPPSVLATPVVIPVSRPSTPLSTPAVPPTPPSSATPPASSTPPVSTPTPVLPTPNISTPPPPPPSTTITTLSSVVVSTPISTPSTSSPIIVSSTPPVSAPSTIVSVTVTSSTPPLITSTPLKVISKPTPTLVPHPVQTIQGSIPVNVSIPPNNNALQNRNSLEPTTLIDPVTGLLIPMQESEEGQYIPLHSDLNRAEGEPAKKRLRIHAEVTRPSVVRQVLPPSTTVLTHNVQPQVCHPQQHQVVQPPVSQHHQAVQPPVSQHHQVVQPPTSQLHQAVQPPVSQQPQVVDPPVSQHHQVVQPPVSQQHQVVQPPVSQHLQVVQPAVTQHHQGVQPLVPQHHQVLQPPVSQHHQVVQPPVSQHHQVSQPIVSQHHQVVQTPVSQHHQVVQPPMSQHHQIVQPQVSQHHHLQHPHLQTNQPHISQHQSHPPQHPVHQSQVSLHQLQVAHHAPSQHPMSQHQPPQHSMSHQPPQHHPPQSHMNAHPVCQPPKSLHHHQSLATVTPVLVSHQPPPLMPVSSPHHPSVGHHIQPSVQIQSITKPGTVSKSHSNIPLATVTVSTPKMLVSKSEPSTVKGLYPPHSIDSPSMAHPSVLHSVPSIPSVVHTTSSGHGVHGSVLQSGVPMGGVVNQRSIGAVHPAPAHSPALNPAPAHSPALHPTPAHSPVHPTPAHHPLIVRTVPHGLNPPAAHMQHAHAIHTPSHADSHRAVPSPAPGAPPGLPVACKPAPITPKAHLLQAVRPRASPSTAHPPPPKAHIHTPITNIRDGSLASTAGPLGGSSINSPPPRAAHQQPPTHLHNPPTPSSRVVIKPQIGSMERARETSLSVTSPQPRPSHVQPGLPMSASYEPSMHVDGIMGSSSHWGSQRSRQTPPPAHQHSSQGDVVQHFVNAHMQPAHYVPSQLVYPQWMGNNANNNRGDRSKDSGASSPPLELRRQTPPRPPYYETPPPAHSRPSLPRPHTPPHASQVPPQADSLIMLLQRHPVMWQGLLALKNDQAAVQMHFVFGNMYVARDSLPCNRDGSTPPLRIAQRMRLEQAQIDGVSRKMQSDSEHCMLLALPCGRDHMDVLQQSNNLQSCFITYLQQKQAAGIVNIAVSGSQQPAYVIHIFPSCEFANESLARIAPDLMHRVADIAHLLIVIATV